MCCSQVAGTPDMDILPIPMPRASSPRPPLSQPRTQLKIVIVGHVDHGKSTLVGRLIHDTGSLPEGKFEAIKALSERRGMPFEWAFLMDAIQAERDQGITIDTTQIRFRDRKAALRHHRRARPQGVPEEHGDRGRLLARPPSCSSTRTRACRSSRAGTAICCTCWASSRWPCWSTRWTWSATRPTGSARSPRPTAAISRASGVAAHLDHPDQRPRGRQHDRAFARGCPGTRARPCCRRWTASPTRAPPTERPLRMPVQDVYKFDQRRIIAGRIEAGRLQVGDEVVFSPSNKTARSSRSRPGMCPRPRKRPWPGSRSASP